MILTTNSFAQQWWKSSTIYHVYPRSFYDSNNDGIGDIPSITQKLDYIKDFGFQTIWVSPFFTSPQQDFGYDIADYRDISPEYGTMRDEDRLIGEIHKRDMKIVFDMVMNHTSIKHQWFKKDEQRKDISLCDFYIWAEKTNNWKSRRWKRLALLAYSKTIFLE